MKSTKPCCGKLLIVCAKGPIGEHLSKTLSDMGCDVTVACCMGGVTDAKQCFGEKAKVKECNLTDTKMMESMMQGMERMFMMTPHDPNQLAIEREMCQMAKRMQMKQIVKLSAFGASKDEPSSSALHWHG